MTEHKKPQQPTDPVLAELREMEGRLTKLIEDLHERHMVALHGSGYMRRK